MSENSKSLVQPSSDLRSTCVAVAAEMYAGLFPPDSDAKALERAVRIGKLAAAILEQLPKPK